MYNLLSYVGMKAKCAAHKFFTNERGDVNVVAIVILIAVAVILAVLLKDELSALISGLVGKIGTKAETDLGL